VLTAAPASGSIINLNGVISGGGQLIQTGAGVTFVVANMTYTGATTVNAGNFVLAGASLSPLSSVTVNGGLIQYDNDAATGDLTAVGGTVGCEGGGTNQTGHVANVDLQAGSTLVMQMSSVTNYGQLITTGGVSLAGTLFLGFTFTSATGNAFTIISNGGGAVTGTFAGLPEGSTLVANGRTYQITYVGGDGNDVVVTDITVGGPTPTPTATVVAPTATATPAGVPTVTSTPPGPTPTPGPGPVAPVPTLSTELLVLLGIALALVAIPPGSCDYNRPSMADTKPRQRVRYLQTEDGVQLAWAEIGDGPILIKAANWLSHLEYELESPVWGHWIRFFGGHFRFLRWDERGCGLTDRDVGELSFERWLGDLEAVVEASGVAEPFALLGISSGAAVCVAYAARHPERVSRMILYGGYARGWAKRGHSDTERQYRAMLELMRVGWGKENPVFRQIFTSRFIPGASEAQIGWYNELLRRTSSGESAASWTRRTTSFSRTSRRGHGSRTSSSASRVSGPRLREKRTPRSPASRRASARSWP
jgi:autotransporter-associated beta strand protein